MPEPGGAEAFACEQAVGDERAAEAVKALEQQAGFFESTFLAGSVNAHKHLSGRQDGREAIHGGGRAGAIMHPLGKNPHSRYLLFGYMLPGGLAALSAPVTATGSKKPPAGGSAGAAALWPVACYITRLGAA
ncbi:hypothetical protein GmRootV116_05340 [Variovorax sp. V116]